MIRGRIFSEMIRIQARKSELQAKLWPPKSKLHPPKSELHRQTPKIRTESLRKGPRMGLGLGFMRRNGCPKGCFWRVRFFSAPLEFFRTFKSKPNLKEGAEKKRTLQKHPFGQPFLRTTPSLLLWRALNFFSEVRKRVVSKRVVLADVPRHEKPERGYIGMFPGTENWNEGTFGCSPVPKTGTTVHSPKPPFYETALFRHRI